MRRLKILHNNGSKRYSKFFKFLGAGLITGAADDDPEDKSGLTCHVESRSHIAGISPVITKGRPSSISWIVRLKSACNALFTRPNLSPEMSFSKPGKT